MQKLVSLKDLRTKLSTYTDLVSKRGDSFIVIKRSKPVFKIVPIEEDGWETVIDFTDIDKNGISFEDVKKAAGKLS